MVSSIKKAILRIAAIAMAAGSMITSVAADEPYISYNYDWWADAIPSQNGYIASDVVSGFDLGVGALLEPNDIFKSAKDELYIVDTGNNRIIKTDADLNVIKVFTEFTNTEKTKLNVPKGIYVSADDTIYIADSANERVLKCNQEGETLVEFTKPESNLYGDRITYNPLKVVVDKAGNVYTIVKSINQGAVMFAADGTFTGFYGANRVEATPAVIRQKIWRKLLSREAALKMSRPTPVEYANFDIDAEGFIYTVTEAKGTTRDVVKKLNPAGYNIFDNTIGNEYHFGDWWWGATEIPKQTMISDIEVGDNGIINIIDYATCRVFQYDRQCNLLFVFGAEGDQSGSFKGPNAIESVGTRIYIVDGRKNNITVFDQTVFGKYVHEATELNNQGLYNEALVPWNEVIKRDGNYQRAYSGIGSAYLNNADYKTAMEYFKISYDQVNYSKAYEGWRTEFLRENFNVIVISIIVLFVIIKVLSVLKKKGIIRPIIIFKKKQGGKQ